MNFGKRLFPLISSIFISHVRHSRYRRVLCASAKRQSDVEQHFSWMNRHTCKFAVYGKNVEILRTPTQFYDTLVEKARSAKKRIVLASLYLGTGDLEKELVKRIEETVVESRGVQRGGGDALRVHVLLDYTRASRGAVNSCSMLHRLVHNHRQQVKVSLFHSPELRGMYKRFLKEKWNELVGLQHIKVYIFDDDVIISGANLSNDYFTNRQDRYVVLTREPEVADYFTRIVDSVGSLSFQLQPDNTVKLPADVRHHPYLGYDRGRKFKEFFRTRLESIIYRKTHHSIKETASDVKAVITSDQIQATCDRTDSSQHVTLSGTDNAEKDTHVYPLVQMGQFGVTMDSEATLEFLQRCPPGSRLVMASGYFNLIQQYMDVMLKSKSDMRIYTASPKANGFFVGAFPLNHIPSAYTYISRIFFKRIQLNRQSDRISLCEYSRQGWTFHAKGMWYYLPGQPLPSATFIGSSNFGYRSVHRDLECQVLITTTNDTLRKNMHEEQEDLNKTCYAVTEDTYGEAERKVPLWVRLAIKIGKTLL